MSLGSRKRRLKSDASGAVLNEFMLSKFGREERGERTLIDKGQFGEGFKSLGSCSMLPNEAMVQISSIVQDARRWMVGRSLDPVAKNLEAAKSSCH